MLGLFVGTPAALTSLRGPPGYPTYLVTSASSMDQARSKTHLMLSHGTGSKRPQEKPVDQRTGSFPPGPALLAWGLSPRPGLGVHCWSPAAVHRPTSDVSRVVSGWSQEEHVFVTGSPGKLRVPGLVFGRPAHVPWVPCFGPELASLSEGRKIPTGDPKPRLGGWEAGRSQFGG